MKKRTVIITLCAVFGITGLTAASAAYWYHHNFQAAPFKPVQLSPTEQHALDKKIEVTVASDPAKTIVLSEREINGWLQEEGLGEHFKVSIHGGTIALSALMPLDSDIPILGGRTVRFKIALEVLLNASQHRLGLQVSDITVGGISPPNAWLGGIKGRDLLADVELDPTAKAFADGIKSVQIGAGEVRVVLND